MPGADRTGPGYTPVAKALHWLTALAVLGMLGVGLWMVGLPLGLTKLYAYRLAQMDRPDRAGAHRAAPAVALAHPPPPLPGDGDGVGAQRWRRWGHWPAAGAAARHADQRLADELGRRREASIWFGYLPMPDLVPRDPLSFEMLRTLHHWLAWTLMAVLVLHVGGRRAPRSAAPRRHLPPHVAVREEPDARLARPRSLLLAFSRRPGRSAAIPGRSIRRAAASPSASSRSASSSRAASPPGPARSCSIRSDLAAARIDIRMDMRTRHAPAPRTSTT